jgi:GAF domain-containing protein
MTEQALRDAVAAGVLAAEAGQRELLQSIVEVARAIFGARAASIFLLDEVADELVFEAVAGEGSGTLIGKRLPSSTGIAGWVLVSGEPLVLSDVAQDPRFARDVAEATGYVPTSLMAVPLQHEERVLGVLQVLDRPQQERFSLSEMELLGLFAHQAAIALDQLGRARRAREALEGESGLATVARLAATLDALPPERRQSGLDLLADLDRILRGS